MSYSINDPKNITALGFMMADEDDISIEQLEAEITGKSAAEIDKDEDNLYAEYKEKMESLKNNMHMAAISGDTKIMASNSHSNSHNSHSPDASMREIEEFANDDDFIRSTGLNDSFNSHMSNNDNSGESYNFNQIKPEYVNARNPEDSQLKFMTNEEKSRRYIKGVIQDLDTDADVEFNVYQEDEQDKKASLLDQIDELQMFLRDVDIDISNVPKVTKNNTLSEIQDVYKILVMKNERYRNRYTGEEFILLGANMLEFIFDGNREILGYKIDMTGCTDVIKPKLQRMRYETGNLVKNIMQKYDIQSGWTRLVIELLPPLWMHSKRRKSIVNNNDTLANDYDYKEAVNRLNGAEFY